jgi:hypothetical protein
MGNRFRVFFRRFVKIWVEPRQTLRSILDEQPGYHVWTFVLVYAVLSAFQPLLFVPFLGRLPLDLLFLGALLFSIAFDVILLFFFSGFWYLIGKWMGGKGTFKGVMTAYAWSYPPALIGVLFQQLAYIPQLLSILSGETDFKTLFAESRMSWQSSCDLISLALAGWTAVLLVINLSETHKISIPRSIGLVLTILIPFMLAAVVGIALLVMSQFGVHWH